MEQNEMVPMTPTEVGTLSSKKPPPDLTIDGKRKIKIKYIEDKRSRQVTFLKRKNGLLKKAMELGILCNCEVGVIIFNSSNGKLFEYSSDSMERILQRYANYSGPSERRKKETFSDLSAAKGYSNLPLNEPNLAQAAVGAAMTAYGRPRPTYKFEFENNGENTRGGGRKLSHGEIPVSKVYHEDLSVSKGSLRRPHQEGPDSRTWKKARMNHEQPRIPNQVPEPPNGSFSHSFEYNNSGFISNSGAQRLQGQYSNQQMQMPTVHGDGVPNGPSAGFQPYNFNGRVGDHDVYAQMNIANGNQVQNGRAQERFNSNDMGVIATSSNDMQEYGNEVDRSTMNRQFNPSSNMAHYNNDINPVSEMQASESQRKPLGHDAQAQRSPVKQHLDSSVSRQNASDFQSSPDLSQRHAAPEIARIQSADKHLKTQYSAHQQPKQSEENSVRSNEARYHDNTFGIPQEERNHGPKIRAPLRENNLKLNVVHASNSGEGKQNSANSHPIGSEEHKEISTRPRLILPLVNQNREDVLTETASGIHSLNTPSSGEEKPISKTSQPLASIPRLQVPITPHGQASWATWSALPSIDRDTAVPLTPFLNLDSLTSARGSGNNPFLFPSPSHAGFQSLTPRAFGLGSLTSARSSLHKPSEESLSGQHSSGPGKQQELEVDPKKPFS